MAKKSAGTMSFSGPNIPGPKLLKQGKDYYDPSKLSGSGRSAASGTPLSPKEVLDKLMPSDWKPPLTSMDDYPGGKNWNKPTTPNISGLPEGMSVRSVESIPGPDYKTPRPLPPIDPEINGKIGDSGISGEPTSKQEERVSLYLPLSGTVVGTRSYMEAKYGKNRKYKPVNTQPISKPMGGSNSGTGNINPNKGPLEGNISLNDTGWDFGPQDWGPNPPPGTSGGNDIPNEPIDNSKDPGNRHFDFTSPIPNTTLTGSVENNTITSGVSQNINPQPINNINNTSNNNTTLSGGVTENVSNVTNNTNNPINNDNRTTLYGGTTNNVTNNNPTTNNNQSNPVGGLQQNIYNNILGGSGSNQIQPPLPSPSYNSTPVEKLAYETPPITSIQSQYPSYNFTTPGIQQAQTNQFQPIQQKDYSYVQNLPISGTLSQYTGTNQQQTSNQTPWSSPNTSYASNSITQAPSFGMRRIRY